MSMKQMFIAKFTANIGAADGMLEAGTVRNCAGDNIMVGLSAGTSAASFISGFPHYLMGRLGGAISSGFTAINVGRSGKLTASDLFTILAGVTGLAATFPAFAGMATAAAVFTVSGIAVTLYDNMNYKGSDGCANPPHIPLGGIIPPGGGVPDAGGAAASCPLVIDMDGNGVKTISVNKNVFFDLDNNQFAENTGWVDKGDAFLVWDRDNNGVIDSGHELFGNHTLLQNGKKADNGFAALSELDDNNDQVFDEKDKAWFQLQLWFDHNQNGISDKGELVKLSESGIKSINLAYNNNNTTDESGNTHRQQSRVTWKDGRTSDITDVWFNTTPARSYYREEVQIGEDIKAMPNVIAFGNLLDLHAAMAKNPTLKYVIEEYIESNSEERNALLNDLIYEWAGTAGVEPNSRGAHIDARKLAVLELVTGQPFRQGTLLNPNSNAAKLLEAEFKKFADYTLAQLESKTVYKDVFAMKSFLINAETGELEFDWENLNSSITHLLDTKNFTEAKRIISIAKNLGIYNNDYLTVIDKNFTALAETDKMFSYFINRNLVEDQEVLNGSEKDDFLAGNLHNNILNAGDGSDILFGGKGNDVLNGGLGSDIYIFEKGHGQDVIQETHFWMRPNERDTIRFTDVNYADVKFRQIGDDLMLFGYHADDSVTIKGFYANTDFQVENFVFSDRTLSLQQMKEERIAMFGTAQDDIIHHLIGGATVDAGAGNDKVTTGDNNDILIGGTGNDILSGGKGSDTYIFSKGHGQDVIQEDHHWMRLYDADTIRFTDVNYADVKFRQIGDDLILFGYHENDSVTIKGFYAKEEFQIENFEFSDRTLSLKDIHKEGMKLFGTDDADSINHTIGSVIVDAGAGNDKVTTGSGNDTLIGGTGNDFLSGSLGEDTYIFSKGHGQDVIQEDHFWMRGNEKDTVRFTDVNYADVKFRRVADDLMLFGYHEDDSVTIKGFYAKEEFRIENFAFADRTLDLQQISAEGMAMFGTEQDDIIHHPIGGAIVDAGAGNDRVTTGDGNDTLIGGTGNDFLSGGLGADTYIFSKGHGQDVIQEDHHWIRGHQEDTIRFTDVNYENVKFRRMGDDLMLFGYHSDDSVTIKGFYADTNFQIENFVFSDRTLDLRQINAMGMEIFGTENNDKIEDDAGSSVIDAGAGDDIVYAGAGNDKLIGGSGNDLLNGGLGSDTYIFSKGHGQDIIEERDRYNSTEQDMLRFTDVNYSEVKFRRENNNLTLSGYHQDDKVTIKNFFSDNSEKVENFKFADRTLRWDALEIDTQPVDVPDTATNHQVDNLVQAMAAFDPQSFTAETVSRSPQNTESYLDKLTMPSYIG